MYNNHDEKHKGIHEYQDSVSRKINLIIVFQIL